MPAENQRFADFGEWAAWMVTLWIENEEGAYTAWQDRVTALRAEAPEADNVESGIWSEEEYVQFTLADELKTWVEGMVEELDLEAGILGEFLSYGTSETPWNVVALNLMGE